MFSLLLVIVDLFLVVWIVHSIEPWKEVSVNFDCKFNGKPICCSVLNSHQTRTSHKSANPHRRGACKVSKKYIPSAYEEKHRSIVERIHSMRETEERERYVEIRKVIYEEYDDAINVLKLVKKQSPRISNLILEDTCSPENIFCCKIVAAWLSPNLIMGDTFSSTLALHPSTRH